MADNKKAKSARERAADQMRKSNKAGGAKKKDSSKAYWRGVKSELSKVIWPTKKELGSYTVVVIATCVLFAVGFWLVDTGVLALLKGIFGVTL